MMIIRKNVSLIMAFLLILAGMILFGGCTSIKQAPLEIHYYTIEYDPPLPANTAPLPYTIKIDYFQTSPLYDSNRIVFKRGEFTRDEYVYHKWRAHPGELVSFYLARDFSETGRFKATLFSESISPDTHLLTGTVEDFYQQVTNDNWAAILTISVTLLDNTLQKSGNPILLQKKYREQEPILDREPAGLAKAMSAAMKRVSTMIIDDVYKKLKSQIPSTK